MALNKTMNGLRTRAGVRGSNLRSDEPERAMRRQACFRGEHGSHSGAPTTRSGLSSARDAWGFDCPKFASAALRAFATLSTEFQERDAVPWALVKAYYAAFYGAHAIMRLLGMTCSRVDPAQSLGVRQALIAYGLV